MGRIILVVDDAWHCASTLEIALGAQTGMEVVRAAGAEEALTLLRSGEGLRVAALVTDLNMPGMTGFDLIRQVRAELPASLPIVVISGDPDSSTPGHVKALGADAFFSKPFSPSEVRTRLEQLIDASRT
jgi:DNA-binding response OmpR family regulator